MLMMVISLMYGTRRGVEMVAIGSFMYFQLNQPISDDNTIYHNFTTHDLVSVKSTHVSGGRQSLRIACEYEPTTTARQHISKHPDCFLLLHESWAPDPTKDL